MGSRELFLEFSISPVAENIDPTRPNTLLTATQRYSLANTAK